MPRTATVYDIFIASPGDVANEREIAVKVIHKWNDLHSLARGIMLRPVRYEKNSHPTTRYEGQEAVNRQCLDNSDLVIGIFGNRLGTPTSKAESGTAEEIDRHVAAGKEALIFFSEKPVPRYLSDDEKEQLEKLKAYEAAWKSKANVGGFNSEGDFETKFDTALTLYMNSLSSSPSSLTPMDNRELSELERDLLRALARPEVDGVIRRIATITDGEKYRCGNFLILQDSHREKAELKKALENLTKLGYIEHIPESSTSDRWEMLADGYMVVDREGNRLPNFAQK